MVDVTHSQWSAVITAEEEDIVVREPYRCFVGEGKGVVLDN